MLLAIKLLIIGVLMPPVLAGIGYLLMRGWANIVYGGNVPESSVRRKRLEFKLMLAGLYAMVWGVIVLKLVF